jgi:hypothetical protein
MYQNGMTYLRSAGGTGRGMRSNPLASLYGCEVEGSTTFG